MSEASEDVVLFDEFLEGSYDCIDRIVLRAYFQLGQAPAGFRTWWRRWKGSDEGLDNTSLMRIAGRFARRVKGWAQSNAVPLVYSKAGERIEDLAESYLPGDPGFEGVFLIVVGRAPGNVWDVQHTADDRIRRIKRKEPRAWVNHYHFHIMDREWGHLVIRFCPHTPFNALVIRSVVAGWRGALRPAYRGRVRARQRLAHVGEICEVVGDVREDFQSLGSPLVDGCGVIPSRPSRREENSCSSRTDPLRAGRQRKLDHDCPKTLLILHARQQRPVGRRARAAQTKSGQRHA